MGRDGHKVALRRGDQRRLAGHLSGRRRRTSSAAAPKPSTPASASASNTSSSTTMTVMLLPDLTAPRADHPSDPPAEGRSGVGAASDRLPDHRYTGCAAAGRRLHGDGAERLRPTRRRCAGEPGLHAFPGRFPEGRRRSRPHVAVSIDDTYAKKMPSSTRGVVIAVLRMAAVALTSEARRTCRRTSTPARKWLAKQRAGAINLAALRVAGEVLWRGRRRQGEVRPGTSRSANTVRGRRTRTSNGLFQFARTRSSAPGIDRQRRSGIPPMSAVRPRLHFRFRRPDAARLVRRFGLLQATALNSCPIPRWDGPFITIPLS